MKHQKTGPGFVVLYRWRLHEAKIDQFIEAWSKVSAQLLVEGGSLGSRLHRSQDGTWYSYAQWPSAEARQKAFAMVPNDLSSRSAMREAIAEELPEVVLESVSDFMVLPPQ